MVEPARIDTARNYHPLTSPIWKLDLVHGKGATVACFEMAHQRAETGWSATERLNQAASLFKRLERLIILSRGLPVFSSKVLTAKWLILSMVALASAARRRFRGSTTIYLAARLSFCIENRAHPPPPRRLVLNPSIMNY